jgi:protein-disulfide isomerase
MLVALVFGYWLGTYMEKRNAAGGSDTTVAGGGAAPSADAERYRVPLSAGPIKGSDTAKVTIVEFSDFQCPFCSRAVERIHQIEKAYGKTVRIQFRHNPLPFHEHAQLAAEAAIAASAQGKFWEYHDKLFANQKSLDRPDLEKYAQELGLDVAKFKQALDSGAGRAQIMADKTVAQQLGATGTPTFFINGRPVRGAVEFEAFKKVIDEEITNANALLKSGTPAGQLYAKITEKGKLQGGAAGPGQAPGGPPPVPTLPPDSKQVYKMPVSPESPAKGDLKGAKVTLVIFSDFQCPFCSRVEGTLKQVEDNYKGKGIRFVWRNNPLPFHQNAMPAAEAAMAANAQGKFWEFHDKLFANQQQLDSATYEKYAQELGLNMDKFKAALTNHTYQKAIQADQALAAEFGARGTPTFFINGRPIRGALPYDLFKQVIDEEEKKADDVIAKGTKPAKVYDELTKAGLAKAAPPPAQPGEADPNTVYKAEVGSSPVRGAKTAKVTIVLWSDFQCPYCGKLEPSLKQVADAYPHDVRIVWKNQPLPFHQNAMPAAEAAMAAGEQGKFWEFHDKLFTNQQTLDSATYDKYAQELGLNMDKFHAAINGHKFKKQIEEDMAAGSKIGARGTPTFYVNGKVMVGAQPFEALKTRIEDEMKKVDELVKKGTPAAKVYDKLMASAKAEIPAAPPGAAGQQPSGPPPIDKQVFKVDVGEAPTKGPRNAPITLVIFSDFQCPYCSRIEPTLKQVEQAFSGKVLFAWKNYPLPFHPNAMPAAEAAMAAGEQGKFWEMHDKLFADQQHLDQQTFEKYASELGLNMGKFKSALESHKFQKTIQDDVTYGNGISGPIGTPTMFVNGRKIPGAYPFDSFKQVIEEELAKGGHGAKAAAHRE